VKAFFSENLVILLHSIDTSPGVGYGSTLGSFCVVSYYVSVMALTVFYFFASFQKNLPWAHCDPSWATQEICDMNLTEVNAERNASDRVSLPQLYFE
jgi:solute carrier family 6 amino acid transporter-like protein 5/7/9/14